MRLVVLLGQNDLVSLQIMIVNVYLTELIIRYRLCI